MTGSNVCCSCLLVTDAHDFNTPPQSPSVTAPLDFTLRRTESHNGREAADARGCADGDDVRASITGYEIILWLAVVSGLFRLHFGSCHCKIKRRLDLQVIRDCLITICQEPCGVFT